MTSITYEELVHLLSASGPRTWTAFQVFRALRDTDTRPPHGVLTRLGKQLKELMPTAARPWAGYGIVYDFTALPQPDPSHGAAGDFVFDECELPRFYFAQGRCPTYEATKTLDGHAGTFRSQRVSVLPDGTTRRQYAWNGGTWDSLSTTPWKEQERRAFIAHVCELLAKRSASTVPA